MSITSGTLEGGTHVIPRCHFAPGGWCNIFHPKAAYTGRTWARSNTVQQSCRLANLDKRPVHISLRLYFMSPHEPLTTAVVVYAYVCQCGDEDIPRLCQIEY